MVTILAPAKINWSLYVLDKRLDGFHNIISLLHCINLYDELKIEPSSNIEVFSNIDIPQEQNLAYKAALMLKKHTGINKGARITLNKAIPVGAGLGGGSSDAASVLMGLNKFWKLGLDNSELEIMSAFIGSDVPFFFHCPIALVTSRGELIKPLTIDTVYTLLLVKPPVSVSTATAYDMLTHQRLSRNQHCQSNFTQGDLTKNQFEGHNINLIYKALIERDFSLLRNLLNNDFESVITGHFPVILEIKNELLNLGARVAMMTGSGSVVFGLFQSRHKAVSASKRFKSYWHTVADTLKNS